jgi:RNA polymerase sigma-70 factor (ECF subfamily)
MDQASSIPELVRRLREGDPRAAEELFVQYARQLIRLAEQHLSRNLAGKVEGEDIVQSVFRTFFRRSAEGEFRIDSSDQMWRLLVQITLRKARAKGRYHTAERRDVNADESGGDKVWFEEAITQEPGPEQAVVLVDQIEALVRGLPELYATVLDMRLQGYSVAEIAPQVGVSRQTIYRALGLLQQRLNQSQGNDD